jgi:hypothetical protein
LRIARRRQFARQQGEWRARAERLLAALGLAVVIAGAGLGGVASASTTPLTKSHHTADYRTVSVPTLNLKLGVPNGWLKYQLTKQTVSQIVNQLKGNPNAIGAVSELEGSFSQYVKFMALDSLGRQDLLVLAIPLPAGATLSELEQAVVPEIKTLASNPKVSQTTMGGKAAVRIDVTHYDVTYGSEQLPPQTQFYVLEGSNAVALDISGASTATVKNIVRSVHFDH